jgi:hypothetical protein
MPITVDKIMEEARSLPHEQIAELVDRLTIFLYEPLDTREEAWKIETRRRIAEIVSGEEQGIPGDEVSARIQRIIGR